MTSDGHRNAVSLMLERQLLTIFTGRSGKVCTELNPKAAGSNGMKNKIE